MITFDEKGFQIDGQDSYLVSGEFPYFRVPKNEWKRRMQLFIEAGGNCLATYIPWVIHEPEEGNIIFGDCGQRDIEGFLETVQEMGLQVIVRPGPYVYTEILNAGVPDWLLEKYPQVLALNIDGKPIRDYAASYLHPVFLEKSRRYYRAAADIIRPYLAENGGPIIMVQVDNELSGIHLWSDSMDYNPETIGLGRDDGRYANFLRKTYGTIEKLNEVYGTSFAEFACVTPVGNVDRYSKGECLRLRDYSKFYREMMSEYLLTLTEWLREDEITSPICHNSGTATMNCLFEETVRDFRVKGERFLLGSDHYYNLGQNWSENNPSPKYALKMLLSCDTLRALGMPPMAMELPGGSCSDTPPILANDMLAAYMTNLAFGLKGLNYYIFTGGPNFEDTGESCEMYDYGAPVAADGTIREDKYKSMQIAGKFMAQHRWMQRTNRFVSVQVGFEWSVLRSEKFDWAQLLAGGGRTNEFIIQTVLYSLMCSKYAGEMVLLTGKLDLTRPLIVPCPSAMSKEAQTAVRRFAKNGGKVLILPLLPETDLDYGPESSLSEMFSGAEFVHDRKLTPYIEIDGMSGRVYGVRGKTVCEKLPEDAAPVAFDGNGQVLGFELNFGKGKAIFFGGSWMMSTFPQAEMLETLLERLDAVAAVECSNRNIITALWKDGGKNGTVFIMNLYSSPQSTEVIIHAGEGIDLGMIDLAPMEVRTIDF